MKKNNKEGLSIIIPCYNEENNLKRGVLEQVSGYLHEQSYPWEVIICNDHSTDNSLKLINDFVSHHPGFRVLDLPHGGKPSALWGGIQKAAYAITLFTDMDQSTPINQLEKLLPYFGQKYDAVIGSRGIHRQNTSFTRKIMSRAFLVFRRSLLLSDIVDTQCGFKAFRTETVKKMFPHLAVIKDTNVHSGWRVSSYDVELLYMYEKLGLKIKEVEVEWKNEDTSTSKGGSDRFKKESQQMAQEVIRVKINDLKGGYQDLKIK
ncbi:glycosyltransferase [Patescibacteria group bacterium]|nr:glycosyltransferase [Patescibacteria group bacterium]